MPIPTLTGLPPNPTFQDIVDRLNKVVRETNNMLLNLDSLNVVSLTADHINAGTIDANIVTIRSDLTAGAYVQIDGNGLVINDGSRNTFRADITGQVTMTGATIVNTLIDGAYTNISDAGITINDGTVDTFRADVTGRVTMTGALIRSRLGYPGLVMDPATNLFGAYASPTSYVSINPVGAPGGSPQFLMQSPTGYMFMYQSGTDSNLNSGGDMRLDAAGDLELNLPGTTLVPFSQMKDFVSGVSLQTLLNGKATSGISTGLSGSANGGIAPGTVLMVSGGGTVTWLGIPSHSHAQN